MTSDRIFKTFRFPVDFGCKNVLFEGCRGAEMSVRRGEGADARKHRICVPKFGRLLPIEVI